MKRERLLLNGSLSIRLRVSLSPSSRCQCCSRPPKSPNSSALVRGAPWTRRGVPWFAISVSPIRAGNPALLDLRRRHPALQSQCPLWVISRHLQRKTVCPLCTQIATAKTDSYKGSCPLYPGKRTYVVHSGCPPWAKNGH